MIEEGLGPAMPGRCSSRQGASRSLAGPADGAAALYLLRLRIASLLLASLTALSFPACRSEESGNAASEVASSPTTAFVPGDVCADCHEEEFRQWSGSDHALAMQLATDRTVLGDFNDATFEHFGVTTRFFKKDGRFFTRTEGPDGQVHDYEVTYTFGVHPLQQYLVEFPGGRVQCLTVSWDTVEQRWFHLYPEERILPGDPLHWTGLYQNWNMMCGECHTTNYRKNYNPETRGYRTTFHEIAVGCQACHGPGEKHVQWAQEHRGGSETNEKQAAAGTDTREPHSKPAGEMGLLVDFAGTDSRFQVDACAPCHSRRAGITASWNHTGTYPDQFRVQTLTENLYFPDGQILDEVYVFGSFLQSKMYQRGVRCSDCHNPHTLKLWSPGNDVCTQCHQPQPREGFPTLTQKEYDSPTHHFHRAGSPGAECINCHMPERTYMVVDPRRDHSFRIPRPDLSVELGTPNACNQCHTERSAEWAAGQMKKWYGPAWAARSHYGSVIARGRAGTSSVDEAALCSLARQVEEPGIVRATALELLRSFGKQGIDTAISISRDPDPLVRSMALAVLDRVPPGERVRVVAPLLSDPVRRVRIEAARVLNSVQRDLFPADALRDFGKAIEEFKAAQFAIADMPSPHLNLGVMYWEQGDVVRAEREFRTAFELDPTFIPARVNLANLLNQNGRNSEAEQVLRDAIALAGRQGELHYNLGLLLAEMGRLEEAVSSLGSAADLVPNRARIRYNYALALQRIGRRADAEKALLRAHATDPSDADIVYALVAYYLQGQKLGEALRYALLLRRLRPGDPEIENLISGLEQANGR